jgi:hypothetical protein
VISGGPSLLGLNVPATDAGSGHEGGGRDSLRPSSNVDYLLEDEEEPRRSWGKLILIVAALAVAAGFGYLRWKQGGFDWLNASDKRPAAATTQAPDAAQNGDSAATPGGATPATGGTASAGESAAPQTNPSQTSSQATPSQSTPSETAATQSSDQPSAVQSDAGDSNAPTTAPQAANSDSDRQSAPAEADPPLRTHKPAAAKPVVTKPAAAKPVDSVTEAERYIYGRGVGQDCDHGLRLLKPAAVQSNVRAMISLGALYSTGTCTPRDLPTAYRWFAMALHKEPDNQALQDDLQKLWSQMTQPERQLAIRLSQ